MKSAVTHNLQVYLLNTFGPGDLLVGTKEQLSALVAVAESGPHDKGSKTLLSTAAPGEKLMLYVTHPDDRGHWQVHTVKIVAPTTVQWLATVG